MVSPCIASPVDYFIVCTSEGGDRQYSAQTKKKKVGGGGDPTESPDRKVLSNILHSFSVQPEERQTQIGAAQETLLVLFWSAAKKRP